MYKRQVGDSPVIGSGFYSDAMAGSAAATGLGEDIMRGCLSVRVVDLMRAGIAVQDALIQVLDTHMARMKPVSYTHLMAIRPI